MVDSEYKDFSAEQTRELLEKDGFDYDTLSFSDLDALRTSLKTEENNAAENEKNYDTYVLLNGFAKEKIENLSSEGLKSLSASDLNGLKSLISAYYSSNLGIFTEEKINNLMTSISEIERERGEQSSAEAESQADGDTTSLNDKTDTSSTDAAEHPEQEAEKEQEQTTETTEHDAANKHAKDEILQESSAINVYNAVDVSKNLNDMQPSQLHTLRRALNARTNDETQAASAKLDDHIVTQAGKYANDKLALTDMNEIYALNDLLTSVRDHPHSEKAKSAASKTTLNAAIDKSGIEIQNFEEQYGIDNALLQEPQIVESNIAKLDGMPQDKDIFELNILEEKLQPAFDNVADLRGILNTAEKNNSVPEISVLTGMLQKLDKDKAHPYSGWEDLQKKVLELTEKRVKDTKSLEQKDFKNFEYLLAALKESPNADKLTSTLKKKEKLLSDSRQDYLKSASLKDKEFQDIYNILSNIKVNGKLKAFGREQIGQEGTDSDIALFLEQTRRETEMYLACSRNPQGFIASNHGTPYPALSAVDFKHAYADNLRKNLVEVLAADQFSKGKNSKEDYAAMFDKLATAAQSKKGININQDSFIGWQAARTNRMEAAVNRLGQKPGYEKAAKSFGDRLKATDQKLTKKYGKAYSLAKGCLKSAGWGAAYSIAGATLGPVGVAAVATASFANQAYGFIKDFKKERAAAKTKGEKPANLWQYIKKNKLRTAGLFVGTAAAAMGISGAAGATITPVVLAARSYTGIGLATAGAVHQAAQAYKKTEGSKGKKAWEAVKTAVFSGISFGAGMLAGRAAGEVASEVFANTSATTPVDTPVSDNTAQNDISDNEMPVNEVPAIDVNNLSAEQQHGINMLILRDPAEANQILGQEGDHWMNSSELQEAWDNGILTDEQKALLVKFGEQRFDEDGNFQDVEGYKTAAQMKAEAKEWTAAQEAKTLENQAAETPETRRSDFEPIPTIGDDVNNALQGKAETLERSGLAEDKAPEQSEVKINKIKINDEGEAKIVGRDENDHFVERTDVSSLRNMPEDLDYNKIKFHDNGDISESNH